MLAVLKDLQTIKLTVDAASAVWALASDGRAVSTGRPVDVFVENARCAFGAGASLVFRIPAVPGNAGLILSLHRHGLPVEIASPRCCGSRADRADPAVLLYAARGWNPPFSVGGWRRLSAADAVCVEFVHTRHAGAPPPPLALHPAGSRLSFVDGLHAEACASLLALIGDPRWFIDPAAPDRCNKLQQFLGLDPRTQRGHHREREKLSRNRLVKSCWRGNRAPPRLNALKPGQFLWRAWHKKGGGWAGDLAASKRLVSFVQRCWLAAVCRGTPASEVFPSGLFFGDRETAAMFDRHVACGE